MPLSFEDWKKHGPVKSRIIGLDDRQLQQKYDAYVKIKAKKEAAELKKAADRAVVVPGPRSPDTHSVDSESVDKMMYDAFMTQIKKESGREAKNAVIEKIMNPASNPDASLTGNNLDFYNKIYKVYEGCPQTVKLKIESNIKEETKTPKKEPRPPVVDSKQSFSGQSPEEEKGSVEDVFDKMRSIRDNINNNKLQNLDHNQVLQLKTIMTNIAKVAPGLHNEILDIVDNSNDYEELYQALSNTRIFDRIVGEMQDGNTALIDEIKLLESKNLDIFNTLEHGFEHQTPEVPQGETMSVSSTSDVSETSPSEQQVGTNITGETPGTRLVQSDAASNVSSVNSSGFEVSDASESGSLGSVHPASGTMATSTLPVPHVASPDGSVGESAVPTVEGAVAVSAADPGSVPPGSVMDTTVADTPQPTDATQATPFATAQVKNVESIHKVPILLFFGSSDRPNWDLTLQKLINDNEEIIKPTINSLIDSIIASNGPKILVSAREKDSDIEEFNEIVQLHFCLERNMHTGTRTASVTIPLKNLLGGLGGQTSTPEPISGPPDAGPFAPDTTSTVAAPQAAPQVADPQVQQQQVPEDQKALIMNKTIDAYGKPIFPITKTIIKKKTKEINIIPGLPILENLVLYNKIPSKRSIKYVDC